MSKKLWMFDVTLNEDGRVNDYTVVSKSKIECMNVIRWINEHKLDSVPAQNGASKAVPLNASNLRSCSRFKFMLDHLLGKAIWMN